ncbi:hypothetical protein FNV43_RR00979 [Rhamnella rubrinervis]|uniref:Uncharacterized protein n=1 Tax=Rhamnella rubrinervis TaxID=2594499 RepID=A0A8K0HRR0_9ROSA|nr:hypothetical protein FNV43_RR00979 [Rhamnella rubrinervis]
MKYLHPVPSRVIHYEDETKLRDKDYKNFQEATNKTQLGNPDKETVVVENIQELAVVSNILELAVGDNYILEVDVVVVDNIQVNIVVVVVVVESSGLEELELEEHIHY